MVTVFYEKWNNVDHVETQKNLDPVGGKWNMELFLEWDCYVYVRTIVWRIQWGKL